MMNYPTETHPLEAFMPDNARLLMCGTFPPKNAKWSMEFFYPNFINDMWRIMGLVFYGDKSYFVEEESKTFRLDLIKQMLSAKGIALSDTAKKVRRLKDNASDKYLEIIETIDLEEMFVRLPDCESIVTTGEKAASVIAEITNTRLPKVGEYEIIRHPIKDGATLRHFRMPSSSRAYPMKLESKAEYYRHMFEKNGII